ncbi:MAG: 4'-phosphopantetheinyl transferase superfamily protein [Crocinitomix sp.]|nr:4'-phosphopantetheinyl transferase superfamily protein [Crocinitomix sp.]
MKIPLEMRNMILRQRLFSDQKLKLFGRILVSYYHRGNFLWKHWAINENNKPYLKEGKPFNISHSGDLVVVAFSKEEVGVDIQEMSELNVNELINFFHTEEQKFIRNASDISDAFFEIWTKKEAYLKAVGKGLLFGLEKENILEFQKSEEKTWNFIPVELENNYKTVVCTEVENAQVNVYNITLDQLTENNKQELN